MLFSPWASTIWYLPFLDVQSTPPSSSLCKKNMSVLVVTNHHAGLISWPVGPTERWTLKTTIQQKRAYKRKGGTPGGAVHGGCVSSRECRCRPQHLHWRRGYSWHLVTHFTKAPSLPASSRLMQSWALIIFLTLHLYNGMAMQVGADRGITLPSSNSWWSSFSIVFMITITEDLLGYFWRKL